MLNFPAKLSKDGGGWLVTFRDIPEALTSGATKEEALSMAFDALLTAMDFYFEDQRQVPVPTKARAGEVVVALPPSTTAKVLLLNALTQEKVKPTELAKRLKTTKQEVSRILDLHHATKIDTIGAALASVGRTLELRVA